MKTILSIQSQVVGARVGNSVAAFAMERLEKQGLVCPYRSASTRQQLARLTGRKKRTIAADETV